MNQENVSLDIVRGNMNQESIGQILQAHGVGAEMIDNVMGQSQDNNLVCFRMIEITKLDPRAEAVAVDQKTANTQQRRGNPDQIGQTKRRGRPPGSKNKPKADISNAQQRRGDPTQISENNIAPKRRGRPPGSKNKPKGTQERRGDPTQIQQDSRARAEKVNGDDTVAKRRGRLPKLQAPTDDRRESGRKRRYAREPGKAAD